MIKNDYHVIDTLACGTIQITDLKAKYYFYEWEISLTNRIQYNSNQVRFKHY